MICRMVSQRRIVGHASRRYRRSSLAARERRVASVSVPPLPLRRSRQEVVLAYATALGVLISLVVGGVSAITGYLTHTQQVQAQLSSEFTVAITEIGSSDPNSAVEIRLGGVYSLERVVDAAPDQYRISSCDVLAGMVQHRLPKIDGTASTATAITTGNGPDSDVRGALRVIGRVCEGQPLFARPSASLNTRLLAFTDLRGVNFSSALLNGSDLTGCNISGSQFNDVMLEGSTMQFVDATYADLTGDYFNKAKATSAHFDQAKASSTNWETADLTYSTFKNTLLKGADFKDAKLYWAQMQGADLEGAIFTGADLRIANLRGARLEGAQLQGADLSQAFLDGAELEGATYDSKTVWPLGFSIPPGLTEVPAVTQ